jgi:hypothetical protein
MVEALGKTEGESAFVGGMVGRFVCGDIFPLVWRVDLRHRCRHILCLSVVQGSTRVCADHSCERKNLRLLAWPLIATSTYD